MVVEDFQAKHQQRLGIFGIFGIVKHCGRICGILRNCFRLESDSSFLGRSFEEAKGISKNPKESRFALDSRASNVEHGHQEDFRRPIRPLITSNAMAKGN